MIRVLVPVPASLSHALDAAEIRLRALAVMVPSPSRVCIVGADHWASLCREQLATAVTSAVERFERGELGAEAAAREVLRALEAGGDDSTQPG